MTTVLTIRVLPFLGTNQLYDIDMARTARGVDIESDRKRVHRKMPAHTSSIAVARFEAVTFGRCS